MWQLCMQHIVMFNINGLFRFKMQMLVLSTCFVIEITRNNETKLTLPQRKTASCSKGYCKGQITNVYTCRDSCSNRVRCSGTAANGNKGKSWLQNGVISTLNANEFQFFKLRAHKKEKECQFSAQGKEYKHRNNNNRLAHPCEPCNLLQSKSGIRKQINNEIKIQY